MAPIPLVPRSARWRQASSSFPRLGSLAPHSSVWRRVPSASCSHSRSPGTISPDVVSEEIPPTPRPRKRESRDNRSRHAAGRVVATVESGHAERHRYGLAATVLALTGFATFGYEVVWTRVLAMVVGPSIYAFAATLTSFITGLALGSFAGASLAARVSRPAVALALTLTATAAAACVSVGLVGGSMLEIGPGVSGRHGQSCRHRASPSGDRVRSDIAHRDRSRRRVSAIARARRQPRRVTRSTTGRPLRREYLGLGGRRTRGRLRRHTGHRPAHGRCSSPQRACCSARPC